MPKVSVVIPVYNAELYIERCVRSLFDQTLDDIEYIFVNDCTPDKSIEILCQILEEYSNRKRQVKIINHLVNTGQSGARRDGMKATTGDYIIHCDADDWVELDMYEKLYYKAIVTGADAVCCDIVMEFKASQTYLKYNSDFPDHQLMYDCIAPISVEYCSMCNRLISRKIFDRYVVEPFEGVNMWDDVGLSLRLRFYCKSTVVINNPFYHYNCQNELSTTNRSICGRVQEQIECAKKLESFYLNERDERYKSFISLIKLVAKDDLFDYSIDEWRKVFPESHKRLYVLKCQVSLKRLVKYYLYAYCGVVAGYVFNKKSKFLL